MEYTMYNTSNRAKHQIEKATKLIFEIEAMREDTMPRHLFNYHRLLTDKQNEARNLTRIITKHKPRFDALKALDEEDSGFLNQLEQKEKKFRSKMRELQFEQTCAKEDFADEIKAYMKEFDARLDEKLNQ